MQRLFFFLVCLASFDVCAQHTLKRYETDVLVIGGGTGGTAAAIQSARLGVKTILIEPTAMLGGMLTAAGVSCTDGNDQFPSGMWEEFRQALYKHYGRNKLNSGWVSNTCFEPHAGDSIFQAWAGREKQLTVLFRHQFSEVIKSGNTITGAIVTDSTGNRITIKAKVVIDATELGDVFAAAGTRYDVGMDDPAVSRETQSREKNNIIQDLTWAAVLKDYGAGADKTIARPVNYDSTKYFCSTADAPCKGKPYIYDTKKVLNYGKLPNGKYMLNWPAHGNDFYLNVAEESPAIRSNKYEQAKQHTLGFIYFMQTTLGMKQVGLADDELDHGMALIPYNREGRRVRGVVRMNINHILKPYDNTYYRTGIAVGDYPVDHHHAQYPGKVPEIEFPKIPAYNIPMGTLIPDSINGLVVCEKGISVTNIVNGTTRLQPVVLLTGQAAGVLSAKAVLLKKKVREVQVREVQQELLKVKCYLMPFSDVKITDPHWEAIQKVGLTGILKGVGQSEGWANKMFFYPDSLVDGTSFYFAIKSFNFLYGFGGRIPKWNRPMNIEDCFKYMKRLRPFVKTDYFRNISTASAIEKDWYRWGLKEFDLNRPIKRFELSVMLDKCILLFGSKNLPMDMNGKISFQYSSF